MHNGEKCQLIVMYKQYINTNSFINSYKYYTHR